MHCQTSAAGTHLGGIYDGLYDLPPPAEPNEPNYGTYFDTEEFLMDIDPSELYVHDPFENLAIFQNSNGHGVSALAVDDTPPPAAAITDPCQCPNTNHNQYTLNVEVCNFPNVVSYILPFLFQF